MGRPATTTEPQSKRNTPVTWESVAEKKAMQAYAKRRGNSLAGLLKMLLASDIEAHPALAPSASDTPAAGGPVGGGAG